MYIFKNWDGDKIEGKLVGFGKGKYGLVVALSQDNGVVNIYNIEYIVLKEILASNKDKLVEGSNFYVKRKKVPGKWYYNFEVKINDKPLSKSGFVFTLDKNDLPF